jgi:hypothetical protein
MANNVMKILTDFRTNLVLFLDELIEQFPQEGDLVIARIFICDQIPITDIMLTFTKKVLPLKDMVKQRNAAFFLENDVLFENLSNTKVSYFKQLWSSNKLDADDRATIWSWFDLFISLAERYQKLQTM